MKDNIPRDEFGKKYIPKSEERLIEEYQVMTCAHCGSDKGKQRTHGLHGQRCMITICNDCWGK